MSTYLTNEMRAHLEAARLAQLRKNKRLRVVAAGRTFPVLHMWRSGFAVDGTVPPLRGLVDLYDGAQHLYHCLIVASGAEAGEMHYEFKRHTAARDTAPIDHFAEPRRPIALPPR